MRIELRLENKLILVIPKRKESICENEKVVISITTSKECHLIESTSDDSKRIDESILSINPAYNALTR